MIYSAVWTTNLTISFTTLFVTTPLKSLSFHYIYPTVLVFLVFFGFEQIVKAVLKQQKEEVIDLYTPLGAVKIITTRFIKECTPPEIFISGKCILFIGGVVALVNTGGNSLVISGTFVGWTVIH